MPMQAPNGPAAAVKSQDEYTALVQRVQSSLKGTDLAAGDSLRQVLELVKEGLDQGARDRYSLAQVCDIFRVSKHVTERGWVTGTLVGLELKSGNTYSRWRFEKDVCW